VSTESTPKALDHSSDHHESHHSKGASFVDPLGTAEIEGEGSSHGAMVASEAMLEGAKESSAEPALVSLEAESDENPPSDSAALDANGMVVSAEGLSNTKVTSDNADQWLEEIKIRMDKLRQDVDELNARLDRFKRPVVK